MKEVPTELSSFPEADALIDVVQSENKAQAAGDAIEEAFNKYRSGEISRAEYEERSEMLSYKQFEADNAAAAATERVNNGGMPLTRTQKLVRFVFGHKK